MTTATLPDRAACLHCGNSRREELHQVTIMGEETFYCDDEVACMGRRSRKDRGVR